MGKIGLGTHWKSVLRADASLGEGLFENVPVHHLSQLTDEFIYYNFANDSPLVSSDASATIQALASGALNNANWEMTAVGAGLATNDLVAGANAGWNLAATTNGVGANFSSIYPLARKAPLVANSNGYNRDLLCVWKLTWPNPIDVVSWYVGLTGRSSAPTNAYPMNSSGAITTSSEHVLWNIRAGDQWPSMSVMASTTSAGATELPNATGSSTLLQDALTDAASGTGYFGMRIENAKKVHYYYGTSLDTIKRVGFTDLGTNVLTNFGYTPTFGLVAAGSAGTLVLHEVLFGTVYARI